MIEDKRISFEIAAGPLMEWMARNMHPHAYVIVTSCSAELAEALVKIIVNGNSEMKLKGEKL